MRERCPRCLGPVFEEADDRYCMTCGWRVVGAYRFVAERDGNIPYGRLHPQGELYRDAYGLPTQPKGSAAA